MDYAGQPTGSGLYPTIRYPKVLGLDKNKGARTKPGSKVYGPMIVGRRLQVSWRMVLWIFIWTYWQVSKLKIV